MNTRRTGADAGSIPDEAPDGRCGYTLDAGASPVNFSRVCCWRGSWKETGPCIWHADTEDKLATELQDDHVNRAERLDGSTLRDITIEEGFDKLSTCILVRADLTAAWFRKATLIEADLTEADLIAASFQEADLSGADLTKTDLTAARL